MLKPFFSTAMRAPVRHLSFRRTVALHVLILAGLGSAAAQAASPATLSVVGQLTLVLGILEGGALVGWRLTQLPKSQALEFLLVSPVQPRRVFLAEAAVGVARLALVCLSGVPVLGLLVYAGKLEPVDVAVLAGMQFTWGVAAGLGLTVWAYEPVAVRRWGELAALLGVLVYLVVGVLAGEHLGAWLGRLPPRIGRLLFEGLVGFREYNPFGVARYWLDPGRVPADAVGRVVGLQVVGVGLVVLMGARAAFRLKGHYHDRHYRPVA